VDGNLLYALSSDGDLACVETANGHIRWKKSLRKDFGGVPGIWAYSESPLVDGDTVLVTPGGSAATIVALNKKTGELIWKSAVPGGDRAGYASIIVAPIGGVKQYVQFLGNGLVGVDARTGKFLWRYDKTADTRMGSQIATPVFNGSLIYAGSNMVGAGLAKLEATGGTFEAKQVYFGKKLPAGTSGYVRLGDYLYGTVGPALMCVDFKTGDVKWQDRGIGAGSLCATADRLYLHGENGDVALIEATPQGYHEKGRFSPPAQPERGSAKSWNYPVIANGRLYVRDLGVLYCYDIKAAK
jgi:outer membrane protein assembly factor BamB